MNTKTLNRVAAFVLAAVLSVGLTACGGSSDSGTQGTDNTTVSAPAADLVDVNGNLSLYGLLEQSGSAVADTLEANGYTWDDERLWWISSDGNNLFYVMGDADREYTGAEVAALKAGGAGESLHFDYVLNAADYGSLKNAVNTIAGSDVTVVNSYFPADEVGIAVVRDSANRDYTIMATKDENYDAYRVLVFNPEAASSGLLIEWLGAGEGTTAAEVWESITGVAL